MTRLPGKVALIVGDFAAFDAREIDRAVSNEWAWALARSEAGAARSAPAQRLGNTGGACPGAVVESSIRTM